MIRTGFPPDARLVLKAIAAISLGASVGAVARWQLSLALNALFPLLPLGTLAANLIGGYLIGIAVAWFAFHPGVAPEWRLLIITGFLGGLTTFSTFSAEVVSQIRAQRLGWAMMTIMAHLLGSLAMTALGIVTVETLRRG